MQTDGNKGWKKSTLSLLNFSDVKASGQMGVKMKQKSRIMSIKVKILLPISVVVIGICLVMGINSFQRMENVMVATGVEEAGMVAEIALEMLDGDMVKMIVPGSAETEEYQNLLRIMRNMQKKFGIAFMYTLYTDGKQVYYGVDTDESSGQMQPGEIFATSYEELKNVFQGNTYVQDYIDSTQDGDLVTVYKPILDSEGKVVAILGCDYDAAHVVYELNQLRQRIFILGAICLAVALVLLYLIVGTITRSLRRVDKKIYELVHNEGDLTQKLEIRTGDEMELIAENVNGLLVYIRTIMLNIAENAKHLGVSSKNVVQSLFEAEGNIADVSATMEEMSAAVEETSCSLSQVHDSIEDIYNTIEDISQKADEGQNSSEKIMEKAADIYQAAVKNQREANEQTQILAAAVNDKIEKSRTVEQIGQLTANIISITSQTNLLALNASIEAARAGDAGKGFAVVANEIGQLATNSAQAAAQIRMVSDNVTEAVEELAKEAEKMLLFMNETAIAGYQKLLETSESYQGDVGNMSKLMENFATESRGLKESIDGIKDAVSMVNHAMEDSAQGITNVAEMSSELTMRVKDISNEADLNKNISVELNDEVGKFKLQ